MRTRGAPLLPTLLAEAKNAGAQGAEREALISAATGVGATMEQARKAVQNALYAKQLVRLIDDDGHTRYGAAAAAAVAPNKATAARRRKRATRRVVTHAPRRPAPPAAASGGGKLNGAADAQFRCGVLDSGELLLIVGDQPLELTAERTQRVYAALRRHFTEVRDE